MIDEPQSAAPILYGFDVFDPADSKLPYDDVAETPEEWAAVFASTSSSIRRFIEIHNPIELLAKTAVQRMADGESTFAKGLHIEQADLEVLQALFLLQATPAKHVLISPRNLEHFWPELSKHVYSFCRKQPFKYPAGDARNSVLHQARLHTQYSRNLFTRKDCEQTVSALLARMDEMAMREKGFKFSKAFETLIDLVDLIAERIEAFQIAIRPVLPIPSDVTEAEVQTAIAFLCTVSPQAARAWRLAERYCPDLETLKEAGFQLSEMCNSWMFMLDKKMLGERFGPDAIALLENLSLKPGSLAQTNPEHIYLNNPIWQKPIIDFGDRLFMPNPGLVVSFPFQIFEGLIQGSKALEESYASARTKSLEGAIAELLKSGLPSAEVYQNVMWHDGEADKTYENDVVAIIGNTIFLFEAKSGRLNDAGRRGAELSLLQDFRELFVEPGEQAWRLENYLNTKKRDARLWLKGNNEAISLNLEKPKVVHKFSICMEHYASLTSAKHNLKALGLVSNDDAWAPVLALGELQLAWGHLDTEVSFFHYLTRRATLEQVIEFYGDEMDILAVYLTNGLFIDGKRFADRTIMFRDVDQIVRGPKTPRTDRRQCQVYGIPLSSYWLAVVRELYEHKSPHRFDLIQVILNQDPHSLAAIQARIRRWKQGLARSGDIALSKSEIGKRTFVLGCYMSKHALHEAEWTARSRDIAFSCGAEMFSASDCAVMIKFKKSKEHAFDGISFFRLNPMPNAP